LSAWPPPVVRRVERRGRRRRAAAPPSSLASSSSSSSLSVGVSASVLARLALRAPRSSALAPAAPEVLPDVPPDVVAAPASGPEGLAGTSALALLHATLAAAPACARWSVGQHITLWRRAAHLPRSTLSTVCARALSAGPGSGYRERGEHLSSEHARERVLDRGLGGPVQHSIQVGQRLDRD